jgi:hypothetical protein
MMMMMMIGDVNAMLRGKTIPQIILMLCRSYLITRSFSSVAYVWVNVEQKQLG